MTTNSDLLRQTVEARDRALSHGLPDTARALKGIAALIAAVEAEAAEAEGDPPAKPPPRPQG